MTTRKRRQPTPGLKLPSPHNPMTGARAPLQVTGDFPYCALMQVAKADEQENYVTCRGYDPRHKAFFDYVEGDADKTGIAVAKPWNRRTVGLYQLGEVIPAFLPLTGLYSDTAETYVQQGQNPGKSADGQPKIVTAAPFLTEGTSILKDISDRAIDWMFMDGEAMVRVEVLGELLPGTDGNDEPFSANALMFHWDHTDATWNEEPTITVWNTHNGRFSKPATTAGDTGADGWALYSPDKNQWDLVWMEMPGLFYGTLDLALSHGDFGPRDVTVTDVISGYDLWGANHGQTQAVYNPVALSNGPGAIAHWYAGYAGDAVICQWDHDHKRFGIINIEPNQYEWTGQTVNGGANTIWSPPWAPVT